MCFIGANIELSDGLIKDRNVFCLGLRGVELCNKTTKEAIWKEKRCTVSSLLLLYLLHTGYISVTVVLILGTHNIGNSNKITTYY